MTPLLRPVPWAALLLCLFLAACGKADTAAVPAVPAASPGYDTGAAAEPPAPLPAAASAAAGPASALAQAPGAASSTAP